MLLAIDPGTKQGGWVLMNTARRVIDSGVSNNSDMLDQIRNSNADYIVIEMISSYGMAVGSTTFETCVWIGRFMQFAQGRFKNRIYRKDVKLHMCNAVRAKDSNVWQAVLDRYGGKELAVGKKATPGPLYGVKSHARQALAVGLCWLDGVRSVNGEGVEI